MPLVQDGGGEYQGTRPCRAHGSRNAQQAPRDAQYALDVVVERCRTFEQQQKAIAALSFKCDMLWAQLEAIDRGDTRPQAARA